MLRHFKNQPLGLFRCCVSSEETESYALPLNPSTPSTQIISTNPQNSCFTKIFNSNQFQNHRRTAHKRPVTTAATKQKIAEKALIKPKSKAIHHKTHKNHSPIQHFRTTFINHYQSAASKSAQTTQTPFQSLNHQYNQTTNNKAACKFV